MNNLKKKIVRRLEYWEGLESRDPAIVFGKPIILDELKYILDMEREWSTYIIGYSLVNLKRPSSFHVDYVVR